MNNTEDKKAIGLLLIGISMIIMAISYAFNVFYQQQLIVDQTIRSSRTIDELKKNLTK